MNDITCGNCIHNDVCGLKSGYKLAFDKVVKSVEHLSNVNGITIKVVCDYYKEKRWNEK